MPDLSPEQILEEALRVADSQFGGTLATIHADDGTPYPAFVLFHLTDEGEVIYGSVTESQHTRDTVATPEVAFLIDNRDVLGYDWPAFDRVTVEGTAERIDPDDPRYDRFCRGADGQELALQLLHHHRRPLPHRPAAHHRPPRPRPRPPHHRLRLALRCRLEIRLVFRYHLGNEIGMPTWTSPSAPASSPGPSTPGAPLPRNTETGWREPSRFVSQS